MQEQTITISNKLGLHARASSALVNCASRYSSEIIIDFDGKKANAKSIMTLLVLGAVYESTVTISAEGDDEKTALEAVCKLFNDKFGEEE